VKSASILIHHSVAPFVAAAAPDQQLGVRVSRLAMLLARLALGSVLLYAGIVKVPNTAVFADAIANFDILPPLGNWLAALMLPWAEIVIGLLLICGLWVRSTAVVSVLMFLGFTGAVLSALARGLDIECGCFSTDQGTRVGLHTLGIEAAAIAAGILVFIFPRHSLALLRLPQKVVRALAIRASRVPAQAYKEKHT
jgi:putative oxidoreductase